MSTASGSTNCPADSHCPFFHLLHSDDGEHLKSITKQCPAFENGCPFSSLTELEAKALLHSIPANHKHCPALQSHKEELGKTPLEKHWLDVLTNCRLDLFSKLQEIHLAVELRQGTVKAHDQAHGLSFVQQILKCQIKMQDYRNLLEAFYFIYSALEEALHEHSQDPMLEPLYFPDQLYRTPSILEDLQYYTTQIDGQSLSESQLKASLCASSKTQIYADHIRKIAKEKPHLLLAHAYTRYFGDLSGGQIMAKKLKRAFQLSDDIGTAYYEFRHIPNANEFKAMCRQRLDVMPVSKAMADELVQESNLAFALVTDVYNELDASFQSQPAKPANATARQAQAKSNSAALAILFVESSILIVLFALYVTYREEVKELVSQFLN